MRVGTLVKHTHTIPMGYGVVIKIHEMLDYNGHTRVDVHWYSVGTRTIPTEFLKEVVCE